MRAMTRLLLVLLFLSIPAHADDFSFTDVHGKTLKLSAYRGKWVLVNFWATWCPPCQIELPELSALHNAHKNRDLVVIGIAMDYKNAKTVLDFIKAKAIPYPIVLGNDDTASQIGNFDGLPTSFLYNPSGELAAAHTGAITRDDIEHFIK
jgi:thiol-disulfide isomerase/thioredoxin